MKFYVEVKSVKTIMETPAETSDLPPLLEPHLPSLGGPGDSVGKESACNTEDAGLIPGSGRCSEEGNGNPLQYSCLENSTDRGAWWIAIHRVTKSRIQLNN